jgi:glycerol-3-phosphate cytidylyltransferase
MKIGITCSCFDLFHPGHVLMLEEAKQHCDYLIVALQTDPTIDRPEKNKPVQTVYERYVQLKGCKYVDEIIPYSTENDLLNLLTTVNYDVRILGDEYRNKTFTGKHLNKEYYYNSRPHSYSSTELRNRIESSNNNRSTFRSEE